MADKSRFELVVTNNYHQLANEIAKRILELSRHAIKAKGEFTIALSGGSTPKGLYLRMAESDLRNEFNWHAFQFFWGDERWVPIDNIKNNYRLAAETLFTKCDIPVENIHPIRTKEPFPENAARIYEQDIISHFKLSEGELPEFDLILLGLGHDGHTASLFPGNAALHVKDKLVTEVIEHEVEEPRVTLTIPVINKAKHIIFMVSGVEKASILNSVIGDGARKDVLLPAQLIRPEKGALSWYVDKAAMSQLSTKIITK